MKSSSQRNLLSKGCFIVGFFLCLLLIAPAVFAQTNAKIINGDVNLRESYPTFSVSTLYTFHLTPGTSLAIIQKDTRVKAVSIRVIKDRYEWFEVEYTHNNITLKGWIYGGEVGKRHYIHLDPGVEQSLQKFSSNYLAYLKRSSVVSTILIPGKAYAQPDPDQNIAEEPVVKTNPLSTSLVSILYILLFLGSMFFVKKWIFQGSDKYSYLFSFLCGLFVLFILGVISETFLKDLLSNLVKS